jgi:hypothetical protein
MDDLLHSGEDWSVLSDRNTLDLLDTHAHSIPDPSFSSSNEPYEPYELPIGQPQFGFEHINHIAEAYSWEPYLGLPGTLMCQPRSIHTELENTQNLTSEIGEMELLLDGYANSLECTSDQAYLDNIDLSNFLECMCLILDQSLSQKIELTLMP